MKRAFEEENPVVLTERLFQEIIMSYYEVGKSVEEIIFGTGSPPHKKISKRSLHEVLNKTFGLVGLSIETSGVLKGFQEKGIIDGKTAWERMLEPGRLFIKVIRDNRFDKPEEEKDLDVVIAASRADRRYFIPFLPSDSFGMSANKIEDGLRAGFFEEGEIYIGVRKTIRFNPYMNIPIPIHFDNDSHQPCSAPSIVVIYGIMSKMTKAEKIFEGGTGCGWHAAYNAMLHQNARVFGCDIKPVLVDRSINNIISLENGEGKQYSLTDRIKISQGNCLDPSSNELFMDNRPYDFAYLTFMITPETDVSCYTESLAPRGIFIAPTGEKGGMGRCFLNLYYKKEDGSMEVPIKVAPVSFVGAINPDK